MRTVRISIDFLANSLGSLEIHARFYDQRRLLSSKLGKLATPFVYISFNSKYFYFSLQTDQIRKEALKIIEEALRKPTEDVERDLEAITKEFEGNHCRCLYRLRISILFFFRVPRII